MADTYQDRIMRMAANANPNRGFLGDLNRMGRDLFSPVLREGSISPINLGPKIGNTAGRQPWGINQYQEGDKEGWSPSEDYLSGMTEVAQTKWKDNIPLMLRSLRQRDEFKDWSDDELTHYMHRTFSNRGGIMSLV